jgi:hypothetical protein
VILDAKWLDLEKAAPSGAGHLRIKLDSPAPVDLYLAVAEPAGCRLLAMDFPEDVDVAPLRDLRLRGVEISKSPFHLSGAGSTVSLAARSPEFNDIFAALADDVVRAAEAAAPENVVQRVAGRLANWQRFLEKTAPEGLSPEEQAGLFGELWFLTGQLVPIAGRLGAVAAWRGPLGGVQDFQSGRWAVEVKTTRQAAPAAIRIASERQLQSDGLDYLGLVIVALEPRSGGTPTLADAVGRARDSVQADPAALGALQDLLLSAGWADQHAPRYQHTSYIVRWTMACEVGTDFPRLTEHDLPLGVGDVTYGVAVDSCRQHEVGFPAAMARLGGGASS